MRKWLGGLALLAMVAGCKSKEKNNKPDVLAVNIDTTVSPSQDFFLYANGGWIKKNEIPGDQGSWGIGNLVIEENLNRLRTIGEKSAAANAASGSNEQRIGDFWATAMDSAKIEQLGLKPLAAHLEKIAAIKDIPTLLSASAELSIIGSSTFFGSGVNQDSKKSDEMALWLWQGGLGLPEREYYFKNDSATVQIRATYVTYMATLLSLSGDDSTAARKAAGDILAMETRLATASRKIEDLRNPYANYNKMAVASLPTMTDGINWSAYFKTIGVKNIDSVIVGQPEFFTTLNNVLKSTPIDVFKSYLKFNLISDFSNYLPDSFGMEAFRFSKLFSGAKERRPRWKRVIQTMEQVIGEPMGQLYVKEYFSAKTKQRYTDLVEAIRNALHDRISNLTWMTDSTKQKAYAKLASLKKKVGYPEKWKDFSAMQIGRGSYIENMINANTWLHNYEINKLGKPVDRDEWDMTPQTYNAYYNAANNEIVLPAGIFTVPGFRDEELDDATVYGYAAASTIGHEITHGFDDEGRQFDAEGNLKLWWSDADDKAFNARAEGMIKQFNEFEPLPGYHINGKATLGENIADLGGILLGIDAFKKTAQFKENKPIAGLTPMQRYFLGYSLGWLSQTRDESLRNRLLTDVHSPAKYRVNGPFADVDEFYTTFGIKTGSPMYRADSLRVRIW